MKWTDFNKIVVIGSLRTPTEYEADNNYLANNLIEDMKIRYLYKNGHTDPDILLGKYKPQKNDKLFFSPGCIAPRHKVREWGKKNNISITIKKEKATANFISHKWFTNLFDWYTVAYSYMINANNLIEFIKLNYPDHEEAVKKIELAGNEHILLRNLYGSTSHMIGDNTSKHYHYNTNLTPIQKTEAGIVKTYCEMFGEGILNEDNKLSSQTSMIKKNSEDDMKRALDSNNELPMYTDTSLLDYLTEDSITIDAEMAKQIKNMLKSSDAANYVIAMEILANCNYKTSILKILLILKDYGYVMYQTRERNHVNFKSFIKFLDLPDWTRPTFDHIITCMMDKKYLTVEMLKELMPSVKHEMMKSHNYNEFDIKTITVSDKVKLYFGAKVNATPEPVEN